jgi:hypothetical protein
VQQSLDPTDFFYLFRKPEKKPTDVALAWQPAVSTCISNWD